MKNHKFYLNMINKVKSRNIVYSPYEGLKQKILSLTDLNERYKLLIQFSKQFTVPGPEPFYLYCIDTNVKLLPKIQIQIANAYFMDEENFNQYINELCLKQGEESDSGDAWVDKYTGYVIKKKTFEDEMELDDAGNVISSKMKSNIETNSVDELLREKDDFDELREKEEQKQTLIGYKVLKSLCLAFMNFSGIYFQDQVFDSLMEHLYETCKQIADTYVTFDLKNMSQEEIKQKEKNDTILLFYCVSYIFIYVQTQIPNMRIKKTFHGCKKTFNGYPLMENEDYSGIEYMACIMNNIKSNSSPWKSISKLRLQSLKDKLVKFIEKQVLKDSKIILRLVQKRSYLQDKHFNINKNENLSIESFNDTMEYTLIEHFKPIDMIKYKPRQLFETPYEPLQRSFFNNYSKSISLIPIDEKQGYEFVLQSNIEKHGLLFQARLFNKLRDINLLLSSTNGEPFLQNACCNDINNNPLYYFDNNKDLIELIKYNNLYIRNRNKINDFKKANTVSFSLNNSLVVRNNIIISNEIVNSFSEETIYLGFIHFLNFDFIEQPIPNYIKQKFDLVKPSYDSYNIKLELDEKINILKNQGYNFTLNDFKDLLQLVHSQNITNTSQANVNILNNQIDESLFYSAQVSEIDNSILKYIKYKNSNKPFEFKEASSSALRDFKNHLGSLINNDKEYIIHNFQKVSVLSSSQKSKYISLIYILLDNKLVQERIDLNNEITSIMKNDYINDFIVRIQYFIKLICIIIPNQLLNKSEERLDTFNIPKHWNFSENHNRDIHSQISKYFKLMKKLVNNDKIKGFIRENYETLNHIYQVYNNGFYGIYTSSNDDVLKIDPITFYQISLYFYYFALKIYFKPIETGNNANSILKIILTIFEIQKDYNNINNYDYNNIIKMVSKYVEGEKELKTKRLNELSDEERALEKELKKNKLGVWGIGLQKGLLRYDKDFQDNEREEIKEIEKDMDVGTFFESNSRQDQALMLIDELMDENYEGNALLLAEEEQENYDLSRMGDYDEYGERDDFDFDLGAGGFYKDN